MPDPVEEAMSVIAADTVLRHLSDLHFGMPRVFGALGLVPLYGTPACGRAVHIPLQLAFEAGLIAVIEQPAATVSSLKLINKAPVPVLIIDGDEVVGGLQNRIANTSMLVPVECEFDLPVSCVEQGRWRESMATFTAGETAYPSLRAQKVEDVENSYSLAAAPIADQGKVWAEVASGNRRTGTRSATGAMRDAYEQRRNELERTVRRLPYPADGPIGVIAVIAGHAFCGDVFEEQKSLATYWPRLVRSYALEALGKPRFQPSLDSAVRLIGRARKARRSGFRSPGLGIDVRLSGHGVAGAALVHEDVIVHASLFRRR